MQEEQENNAEVMNRLNLSGYEVVRAQYFSTLQNPAMTISNGKLRFNTSCLKKFEDVEYVELLLNSVDRCVAIRPCEKGNPNAIHWGRLKEGRWCASTLGCRGLAKTLFDIMEWEEGLKYRFRGQFVEQGDNKLMLFELDEPEMIKIEEIVLPSKEEEAEGKTVKQMIYIFPPEWAGTFGQPITSIRYRAEHTDIGLILQHGTLLVDTAALTDACARYLAELPERAKQEADWLRQHDVAAALCDMPLWSISACEQAGVPLLYVGNFTWTELYREFLPEHIWKAYAAEYRKIQHGMLYALHNPEMLEFLPRAELSETSLVVRPFHPDEIRAVRARHTCPIVFVALGMSAQFTQPVSVEGVEAHFYVTEGVPLTGSNVTVIPYSTLHTQDYVAAADYVVTKAGWGTVAECLLAQKPMALFARDSVLEDRTTIRKLEQKKLGIKVTYEQLTEMSDLLEQMKQITYPAVPEYHNAAAEIVSKLLTLTE